MLFFHIHLIGIGYFGVDVFFIISGFIVCYVATRQPDHFFAKRLIRIVPLYWVATAAVAALAITFPSLLQSTEADTTTFVKSLLFVPYERPTGLVQPILFLGWTLNYEMFFYVMFAISLAVSPKHAPLVCALILIGLCLLGRIATFTLPWSFWFNPRLLEFVLGMAAFHIYARKPAWLKSVPALLAVGIAVMAVIGMSFQTVLGSKDYDVAICAPLSLLVVLAALSLEGRLWVPPAVVLVGDASYSLYLLHPYVVGVVEKTVDPMTIPSVKAIAAAIVTIALSIAVAVISFWVLEKPTNTWLRRFLKPPVARIA
ncbi:MAG: acyltransferase [Proteobacteria bacterium]|nr:acyltransferase [Pseudomonadota bacterium]